MNYLSIAMVLSYILVSSPHNVALASSANEANSCAILFPKDAVASKKELATWDLRYKLIRDYDAVHSRLKSFMNGQLFSGRENEVKQEDNPISEYMSVSEGYLREFELSPYVLEQMGALLRELFSFYSMKSTNPNRSILIGIDQNWYREDQGLILLLRLFYNQKNHTQKTLWSYSMGNSVQRAIHQQRITPEIAKIMADVYEAAVYRLPLEEQFNPFFSYYDEFISFQSWKLEFRRDKVIQFLKKLVGANVSVSQDGISTHMSITLESEMFDAQLSDLILKLISMSHTQEGLEVSHAAHIRRTVFETFKKRISSSPMEEGDKTKLIQRADEMLVKL